MKCSGGVGFEEGRGRRGREVSVVFGFGDGRSDIFFGGCG